MRKAMAEEATRASGEREDLRAWALVHGLAHPVAERQIDAAQAEDCLS